MDKRKQKRNRRAAELFGVFLKAHCKPCLRARQEKRDGWRPLMSACPRCGCETGRVFAEFLDVWGPELEEYARTRKRDALGSHIGCEDVVAEFNLTLARVWYAGFTPGKGSLVHYQWRAVKNAWVRVIQGAFRKRNTIEREQAWDDDGDYASGVPAARLTKSIDFEDDAGRSLGDRLPDRDGRGSAEKVADEALCAEVRDSVLRRLDPLDQAVFWDLVVNRRLEPGPFAEEHRVSLSTVKRRLAAVKEVVAAVAEEYAGRLGL